MWTQRGDLIVKLQAHSTLRHNIQQTIVWCCHTDICFFMSFQYGYLSKLPIVTGSEHNAQILRFLSTLEFSIHFEA